ncbi:MAG: ABC transporter permease [Prevotellaceae bacterium]|nr:ABC transporter permease [Prevotellaceae bacterium]
MKQFLSFVRKEFYHIFRDRRTMLILLVMPVIMVILFGFAITTKVKDTQVAIFDPSKDVATRHIRDMFQANRYFTIAEELTDPKQINDVFMEGKINMVIVFSENFADNMIHTGEATVQLLADGTEPNQASMRVGYAQNILSAYQRELAQATAGRATYQIVPELKMLYNPQQKSEFNFVPGVIGMMLLLICAMMSSIAIVREKEMGTMEVLLASPLPPAYIIIAKAVPYFTISCVNLTTILLLSAFMLHIPIAGSLLCLVGIALLYILVALSLGLLISTIVDSQLAAMLLSSLVLMIPTILLSGTIFPIESMPVWLQKLSAIVPARWFIEAVRKLMIQGVEVQYVRTEFIVLCVMIVLLMSIALKKFKIRLE